MTKKVRIENADMSNHKVVVQVFDKGRDGAQDVLVTESNLNNPFDMAEVLIFNTRYIVIKEASN